MDGFAAAGSKADPFSEFQGQFRLHCEGKMSCEKVRGKRIEIHLWARGSDKKVRSSVWWVHVGSRGLGIRSGPAEFFALYSSNVGTKVPLLHSSTPPLLLTTCLRRIAKSSLISVWPLYKSLILHAPIVSEGTPFPRFRITNRLP